MDTRRLGKSGLFVTPVGMGTLTMGATQKNLSIEEGADLIVYAVKRGIHFLDTAQYYDTYRFLRPALDRIRAERLPMPVLSSKTLDPDGPSVRAAVLECLDALALDRIDIFLLHEVRGIRDLDARHEAWEELKKLKTEGLVRAIGISTHHADACAAMADDPACDVVFTLLNHTGMGVRYGDRAGTRQEMEHAVRACSEADIGVFTMKPFGGGCLVSDYRACLDYTSRVPGNVSVMIGMASREEIDRAIDYFEARLDPDYAPDVTEKRMRVDQGDCEGCGTCIRRCVSRAIHYNENGLAEIDPTRCVRCGYCAPVCPVRAIIFL